MQLTREQITALHSAGVEAGVGVVEELAASNRTLHEPLQVQADQSTAQAQRVPRLGARVKDRDDQPTLTYQEVPCQGQDYGDPCKLREHGAGTAAAGSHGRPTRRKAPVGASVAATPQNASSAFASNRASNRKPMGKRRYMVAATR